jgi:hypothetical protein
MSRPARPAGRLLGLLVVLAGALVSWGHVGSPNVFYQGSAGPYPVRIVVRPPVVIPGLAEIAVRDESGRAGRVSVQPMQWDAGPEGAPPPEAARPVAGAPGLYSAQLWLMTASSYDLRVEVAGLAGQGTAIVPVSTARLARLEMRRGTGAVLLALGAFLFVGGLTLVGAAVRESALAPGAAPDAGRRRRARLAVVAAVLLFALVLWGGKRWWDGVDADYRAKLYRPYHVAPAVAASGAGRVLALAIDDPRWGNDKNWTPLVPDHGKLMHLFLIREPDPDAFAHLHPLAVAASGGAETAGAFRTTLPPLPAGRYRLYADITQESGFAETLVSEVDLPAASGDAGAAPPSDPDDSWHLAPAAANTAPEPTSPLAGGLVMTWERGAAPLAVGREADLRFAVRTADGRPAPLEPYMGMLSHAVIARDDGRVFVHLHPMGSVSMASQQLFERREKGRSTMAMMAMDGMDHAAQGADGVVSFPYEFPAPGRYRLWVQVKSGGTVRTGVFDARVQR